MKESWGSVGDVMGWNTAGGAATSCLSGCLPRPRLVESLCFSGLGGQSAIRFRQQSGGVHTRARAENLQSTVDPV